MKLRHVALAAGIFVAFASHAAAQDCRQWTISDTPPLDRIVIGPLTDVNGKCVKFTGSATLHLEDGTETPLEVKRKLRKKKNTWKYKLKTGKRVDPKVRVVAEIGIEPENVSKFKLLLRFKGEKKLKLKDPTKVELGPCPPMGSSFTVGPAGGSFDAEGGKVSFFFPVNAVTEDTTITVTPAAPPAGTDFFGGTIYRFEPDMSFLQPVDLTISYDEAAITGDENDLRLAKFLEGDPADGIERLWVHSGVDTVANRVTGFITGFSYTAIGPGGPRTPNLSADVNTDRSVTLDWTAIYSSHVIIERAKIVRGGSCSPSHPSCIDGELNGMQAPTESDFAAGLSIVHHAISLTWTDHGPRNEMGVYYYRIRGFDGRTQSAPSPNVRAIVFGATLAPPDPTNVRATAFVCGGVAVRWSHVLEADSYQVERKEDGQGDHVFRIIAWPAGTDTFHVDSSRLTPATNYVYRVVSKNSAGWSPGAVRANVTSPSAQYTVALSNYRPTIAPGESVTIDVIIDHLVTPVDVTLSATVDSTRVTAEFDPPTTSGDSQLTLTVDPNAPCGLRVAVQITTDAGCPLPTVIVVVEDPQASVNLSLDSIDPEVVAAGMPIELMLYGTGFIDGADVHVGSQVVGTYFVDSMELYALVPKLPPGLHMVKVVNPDGSESNELKLFAD